MEEEEQQQEEESSAGMTRSQPGLWRSVSPLSSGDAQADTRIFFPNLQIIYVPHRLTECLKYESIQSVEQRRGGADGCALHGGGGGGGGAVCAGLGLLLLSSLSALSAALSVRLSVSLSLIINDPRYQTVRFWTSGGFHQQTPLPGKIREHVLFVQMMTSHIVVAESRLLKVSEVKNTIKKAVKPDVLQFYCSSLRNAESYEKLVESFSTVFLFTAHFISLLNSTAGYVQQ